MRLKAFSLVPILLVASVSSASRVSGTYIGHGMSFTEMLRLTETGNGQLSGVLSWVELESGGRIKSEQAPVTGTVDSDQLTLKVGSGLLSFLTGTTVAGTVTGNTIKLQTLDAGGNVASHVFTRGTDTDFKVYADQLKSKGAGIEFSAKLIAGANKFRATIASGEDWIRKSQWVAEKTPAIRMRYQEIENKMRSLVGTERTAYNPATRGQLSVAVNQGDNAGVQVDIEVDQMWDLNIVHDGAELNAEFTKWDGKCGESTDLQKRGATPEAAEAWLNACKAAVVEREKFAPIYKRILDRRAEVRSIELAAQSRRKELVAESNRIEQ